MSQPGALLVRANGDIYSAIRIAKSFAGERGSIATFPEIVEASLARPTDPLFNQIILSSSIFAMARTRHRGSFKGCISHTSGFIENPDALFRAYRRAVEHSPRSFSTYGGPNYGHIDLDAFQSLYASDTSHPVRIPVQPNQKTPNTHKNSVYTLMLLQDQMRAVLGPERMKQFIPQRRQALSRPNGSRYLQNVWRRGSFFLSCGYDTQTDATDFIKRKHALVSPLAFLKHRERNGELKHEMTGYTWAHHSAGVLAWRNREEHGGEIIQDPRHLEDWKVGRTDCFHQNDAALPPSTLFYSVYRDDTQPPGRSLLAHRMHQSEEGHVGAIPEALCHVAIEYIGEHMLKDVLVEQPLTPEHWAELVAAAPPGTQAVYLRTDLTPLTDEDRGCSSVRIAKRLPVQFLRIRSLHPQRYLSAREIVSDPERYLRLIGAIN